MPNFWYEICRIEMFNNTQGWKIYRGVFFVVFRPGFWITANIDLSA